MPECNASQEYSCIRRSIVCQDANESKEKYEKSCKDNSWCDESIISVRKSHEEIHCDNWKWSHKNSHKKSHSMPSVPENKRRSISPEIDWKENNPKCEKWEKKTLYHVLFSTSYLIGTNFPCLTWWIWTTKKPRCCKDIDTKKDEEKSDKIREEFRITHDENTKEERKDSKELHRKKIKKT